MQHNYFVLIHVFLHFSSFLVKMQGIFKFFWEGGGVQGQSHLDLYIQECHFVKNVKK